jgi:GTP-binding protein HflX
VRFRFPAGEGSSLHLLHEFGRVIETRYAGEYCEVEADVPESLKRRLAGYLLDT